MPTYDPQDNKTKKKFSVERVFSTLKELYDNAISTLRGNQTTSKNPSSSTPDKLEASETSSSLNLNIFTEAQNINKEHSQPTNNSVASPPPFTSQHPDAAAKLDNNIFAKDINKINAQPEPHKPKNK